MSGSCRRRNARERRRFWNSEIPNLGGLQLKLELVCDEGDKFRIGGLSLGIAHGIAEEPLEGIEVASVPGDFDGVCGLISPQGGDSKSSPNGLDFALN